MKQREIEKCGMCGKGVMHKGSPLFFKVSLQRMAINVSAVRRQHGLELLMGHAALAAALSPDEDIAEEFDEAMQMLLCDDCAVTYPIAVLEQRTISKMEKTEGGEEQIKAKIEIECSTTGNTLPAELNSENGPFRKAWTKLANTEAFATFVRDAEAAGVKVDGINLLNAGQTFALGAPGIHAGV